MKISYTIEDCFVLFNILKTRRDLYVYDEFEFYEEVIVKARDSMLYRVLKENEFEGLIRAWVHKCCSLDETKAIADFIFETEFKKVALYINNESLKIFVEWRLKIAK